MDRRAVALRNRRFEDNNVIQEKLQQPTGVKFQNCFQHKGNRPTLNGSPIQAPNEMANDGGLTLENGNCIVCKKLSLCACERCGDFYCSTQCQRIDWPSHRYICFPIPRLVHPSKTLSPDMVCPSEKPLLTVRQLNNNQQQDFDSQTQHQQKVGNNINKVAKSTIQVQKNKEPTATIPVAEMPMNNSHVMLTGFRTPNRCYVRVINPYVDADYELNARKIDDYGKSASPLGKMPKVHSYAIAPYDGKMHRVEVLMAKSPTSIRLLFVDRGNVDGRHLTDLREITDEIILLKSYAWMVQLRNVSNYVLDKNLVKHFSTYEHLEFKIKYDRIENGAELFHWQTDKSLNVEIEKFCKDSGAEVWADSVRARILENGQKKNKTGKNPNKTTQNNHNEKSSIERNENGKEHDGQFPAVSTIGQNSIVGSDISISQEQCKQQKKKMIKEDTNESVKNIAKMEACPTMKAPFETHYFEVGCAPFKAVVVDVSWLEIGYIGCIAQKNLDCLKTVHEQLESIEVSEKPYKPQLNEYCIALFEDMWFRAQVTDIPDESHFTVTYIDFTNEATLTSSDIRHYPAGVTGACKTNLCLIDGLPSNFSAELIKFLKNEIELQTTIDIDTVTTIDEQVVVVECRSLLEKLRKNQLLD